MTREEAIEELTEINFNSIHEKTILATNMAIEALKAKSCGDAISRQAVIDGINRYFHDEYYQRTSIQDCRDCFIEDVIKCIPSVTPQQRIGHCKECKYFENDSVVRMRGIPFIVAHEICSRWGNGCKTKEDGYCFMFEPKMQEVQE